MSKSNTTLKSDYNVISRLRDKHAQGIPQPRESKFEVGFKEGLLRVALREDPSHFCYVSDDARGMTEAALRLTYDATPRDAARTAVRWALRSGGEDGRYIHQQVIDLLNQENEDTLLPKMKAIQIARAYDSVLKVTWTAQDDSEIVRWYDARELTKLSDDALVTVFCTGNLSDGERRAGEPTYTRWQYLKAVFTGTLE